uniref:G-protein coupled receptors family 1 profile domain-containing protein n=1 Tax=Strongyloides stercoralis TaxID=6248 RepID=A0AAF5D6Q6_STRER
MKKWHLNYRTTFFVILISILIHSFSTTINDIFLLTNIYIIHSGGHGFLEIIFDVVEFLALYTPGILRIGIWIFVVERLIATRMRKSYEKKRSIFLAIGIFFLPDIYGVIKLKRNRNIKIMNINENNKNNKLIQFDTNNQSNLKSVTVTGHISIYNDEGKKIPTNYDQKAYFEMFAKSWDK